MSKRTSTRQATGSAVTSTDPEASIYPLPLPFVGTPAERTPTSLTERSFNQLCSQFGIPETDALLPNKDQFADRPPSGFVAVNKLMCQIGAIPPFNPFLSDVLRRLAVAPFQLHPNGYAILLGLCVLFERTFQRLPSFEEVCFFYNFVRGKDHPSILYVRSARNRRLILDIPDSAHGFLNQFFYVRCPDTFYGIWMVGGEIDHLIVLF